MKIIKNRVFKILVILFIVGFFLGIIFNIIINDNSKLINYFTLIKDGSFNYLNGFISSMCYNYKIAFIIWIIGIVFFLFLLIPFIIIFRGISLGFTLCGIICSFGIKGLIIGLIMLFPCILLNEFVYILLSYYSINFSYKCFKVIKTNKLINIRSFIKNYFYIFTIILSCLLISSLFEIFITSNILKFVL